MNAETYGRRAVALFIAVATTAVMTTSPTLAQSDNRVAAEALFREARQLLDAGQYSEACEKLASSQRLDPAVGTLVNLAHCYEKLGRTATAWETYREAIAAAKQGGQLTREKAARRAADQLEPALPHLTIAVSPQPDGAKLEIRRDGVLIVPELWGNALPVDPGEHAISAAAPGRQGWSSTIMLEQRTSKSITVPPLEQAPERPPAPSPLEPAPAEASGAMPHSLPVSPTPAALPSGFVWNPQRTWATIAGLVGLAGVTVAIVEYLNYASDKNEANLLCPGACQADRYEQALPHLSDARSAQTVAIAGAAVGGAALVGSAVLWLTAGNGSTATARGAGLHIAPIVSSRDLELHLAGAW